MFSHPAFQELATEVQRVGRLSMALGVMSWDQETCMPSGGATSRAAAKGELTELVHRLASSEALGEKIEAAKRAQNDEGDPRAPGFLRAVERSYNRRKQVPPELAEELARTTTHAVEAWKQAHADGDFAVLRPHLETILTLKRRQAEAYGYENHIYDALLDDFEPYSSTAAIESLVDAVKTPLLRLVESIVPVAKKARVDFLRSTFAVERQRDFALEVIRQMGFDFERGRVDESRHPFCTGLSPGDVRLTTRYSATNLLSALFGLIHEAGHGIYEQGFDPEWDATPLASAISMGIHESQSRLWENNVGRSLPFWQHFLPPLRAHFPEQLDGVDVDTFVGAVNIVRPSLIRVEADEATYNLHIMMRFEVEKELLLGRIEVAELPEVWNQKSKSFLGLTPPNDRVGVLQDIHWSLGAFGYFPTYFLGNLYSAQLFAAAQKALPDLDTHVSRGNFAPLREWLRTEIHQHGCRFTADELCQRLTGSSVSAAPFLDYLSTRLNGIYS